MLPGDYTVRLTVDSEESEKTLSVLMDPRVNISEEDLMEQSELSKVCYNSYNQLQSILEAIDSRSKVKDKLLQLRGTGVAGEPDIMYGSIRQAAVEDETVVGLQHKFLFMLKMLQAADHKIPTQAVEGIDILKTSLVGINARYERLK